MKLPPLLLRSFRHQRARGFGWMLLAAWGCIAVPCLAADEEIEITYHSKADWDRRVSEISTSDEIRMTLAQKWTDVPDKMAKDGTITYRKRRFRDQLLRAQAGVKVADEIIPLLEFQPHTPDSVHGCFGLFNVWFYKEGKVVGSLHYAHGRFWAPITRESQKRLLDWLKQHEFPIAEVLAKDSRE